MTVYVYDLSPTDTGKITFSLLSRERVREEDNLQLERIMLNHRSIAFFFLHFSLVARGLHTSPAFSRRDLGQRLGRVVAAGTAIAAASPPFPVHAALPCLDGSLRWKRYRDGTGPKPPEGCVEIPYNESPEFSSVSQEAVQRKSEATVARRADDETLRVAFRRASAIGEGSDVRGGVASPPLLDSVQKEVGALEEGN